MTALLRAAWLDRLRRRMYQLCFPVVTNHSEHRNTWYPDPIYAGAPLPLAHQAVALRLRFLRYARYQCHAEKWGIPAFLR